MEPLKFYIETERLILRDLLPGEVRKETFYYEGIEQAWYELIKEG